MTKSRPFPKNAVNAFVDGEPVDPRTVACMKRIPPLPGGHRFRIEVRDPGVGEFFPFLRDPGDGDANRHFGMIDLMLSGYLEAESAARGELTNSWFLNEIDRATCTDDMLVLEGVCSPVLSQEEWQRLRFGD